MNTNIVTHRLAMTDAPPHLAAWHGTWFAGSSRPERQGARVALTHPHRVRLSGTTGTRIRALS
jgi:hypothetical protein